MENTLTHAPADQFVDVQIQPYTAMQLAQLYGISKKTMYGWIKRVPDLGERMGKILTIAQVKKIFSHIGTPQIEVKPTNKTK